MIGRRNFLYKSLLGAGGMMSMPWISAKAANLRQPQKTTIHFASDTMVLEQARKNILKVRQRDARLQLLDREGTPVRNEEVGIRQKSHQFLFGDNNWSMSAMVRNGMAESDRLKYFRKRFAEVLNALNTTVYWTERPRNDAAKSEDFQGEIQWNDFDESVNWALSQGLTVKGHPMYWTVPKAIPEWLAKYPYKTHMKFVEVRIRNLAARYKNRVKIWDAVNEMLWEPHPKNLAQRHWPYLETMDNMVDYISSIIFWAREEDSDALYTINDYGLSSINQKGLISLDGAEVNTALQRKRYIELIQRLGDSGACPNMMGLQCHTGWLRPGEQMAFYDEMSTAGIPLSITEFWANLSELKSPSEEKTESEEWRTLGDNGKITEMSDDELTEIRDRYVLDYLTCAFAHPNVDNFFFWGLMGMGVKFFNDHNSGHEIQPIFSKINDLIHNQWQTHLTLKTDNQGIVSFRGFCGDYTLQIKPKNGPAIGNMFRIDKNQQLNSITLKTII